MYTQFSYVSEPLFCLQVCGHSFIGAMHERRLERDGWGMAVVVKNGLVYGSIGRLPAPRKEGPRAKLRKFQNSFLEARGRRLMEEPRRTSQIYRQTPPPTAPSV
jgi:hypothetical protein